MTIDLSEVKDYFNDEEFDWNSMIVELEGSIIMIHKLPIWKTKQSTYQILGLEHIHTKEDAISFIKDNIDRIKATIEWVEMAYVDIGRFLIKKGIKDRAEEWMNEDFEANSLDIEEEYEIIEQDGCQFVHLSDEKFIKSLDICDIVIDCNESPNLDKLYLEILFDPDYFYGRRCHVEADKYRNLTCMGI